MKTLLIDGDTIAHQAAHAPANQEAIAVNKVRKFLRQLNGTRAIVCLSDPTRRYFRHDLFPGYKPKRGESPAVLPSVVAAIATEFVSRWLPGLEGDDVMGILATHPSVAGEKVIVARDKDLQQIPGEHFDPVTGEARRQTRDGADRYHLWQTVVGDTTDGYPGCPGAGPVAAEKILPTTTPGEDWLRRAWINVVLAFKSKGLGEADALLQARVARILRADDYDLAEKRVIPWTPPGQTADRPAPAEIFAEELPGVAGAIAPARQSVWG